MDPDQIVSPPFDFMRITSALLPHIGLPWHSLRSWGTAIWIDMSLFIQLPVLHGILPPSLSGATKTMQINSHGAYSHQSRPDRPESDASQASTAGASPLPFMTKSSSRVVFVTCSTQLEYEII